MRIAFLSTFYPYRGGIAQFNAHLYEALKEKHEVRAYNFTRQYPGFLFPGKTQYVTPEDKAAPVESVRILDSANPLTWRRSAKTILKDKPDMVVFGYWMSYFAISLGQVASILRKRGVKVVSVVHNAIPHEPRFFDRGLARRFFKKNDLLLSMCSAVTADIRSLCPDARIIQQAHPIYDHFGEKMDKSAAQKELGLEPGIRTLLFFGLIRDYKGLDLLIDAMPLLGEEFRLVIAGECYGSFDKYEKQIAASGCRHRISVLNRYIGDDEVPRLFSAADVCVLPYRSASQSGITAIALHFETPLVVTPAGGLAESIEELGIGRTAGDISSEAVAEAVRQIFDEGIGKYIEKLREARKNMTWEVFAERISQCFLEPY